MITNIELVLSIYTVLDSVKSNYTLYMYVIYFLWHRSEEVSASCLLVIVNY